MIPGRLVTWTILGYQKLISRYTPSSCRFYPTCSQYGLIAVRKHGIFFGILMGAWRILRCNPWSAGGIDHVPDQLRFGCCASTPDAENPGECRG